MKVKKIGYFAASLAQHPYFDFASLKVLISDFLKDYMNSCATEAIFKCYFVSNYWLFSSLVYKMWVNNS